MLFRNPLRLLPLILLPVAAMAQPEPAVMGLTPIDEAAGVDEEMVALLAPYKEGVDKLRTPIAVVEEAMPLTSRDKELGGWVADRLRGYLARESGEAIDMFVLNAGGIRSGLDEGEVSTLTITSVLPFENTLAIFDLSGAELLELGAFLASQRGWNPVSGARITHGPEGELLEMLLVDDEGTELSIDPGAGYTVGTISFLADGGARFDFFAEREYEHIDTLMRDAVAEELHRLTERGAAIKAPDDGPRYREVGGAESDDASPEETGKEES